MAKIVWDKTGEKKYEAGVSHGVLYPFNTETNKYDKGYAWNGLTGVTESPEGAEPNDLYADDIKYASLRSAETFGGTIEAYTYPDEFAACDGSASLIDGVTVNQQGRSVFGFSYRTVYGSDAKTDGYKLHLVYGATCSPSEKSYETINDSPDAITFSWEFDTTPINVAGMKPTSLLIIDSTKVSAQAMAAVEKLLYGDESTEPQLPTPDEIKKAIEQAAA